MKEYTKTDRYGKYYYKDKEKTIIHREDGPAVEYFNGSKQWWLNGERHRMNGPAVEYADGSKVWYINGILIFKLSKSGRITFRM